jgi:ABC-type phosphate/phosphonate transport system substrate-binding protein
MAFFLAVAAAPVAKAADYTFRVQPDYPPDQLAQIYAPLMKYLDKATGQHFVLVPARNYHFYWREIQQGVKTDFAFEAAHFTDYRIEHQKFEPLVRTAEETSYTLVSNIDIGNKGTRGLIGHKIVTMGAPSLGYTLLLTFFTNPILQPDIVTTATSWQDATDRVFAGEADAAMIPTSLKDKFPNLTPVKTTRTYPGQCISASADVPAELRDKVTQALLTLDTDSDASQLLFDLGVSKFVPATAKEFAGDAALLNSSMTIK